MHLQESITRDNIKHTVPDSYERTYLGFFYIGEEESAFAHLSGHFEFGYKAPALSDAVLLLQQMYSRNSKLPDVIFIDVPLNEEALAGFYNALQQNIILHTLPVIYNEKQLTDKEALKLNRLQLVDDVLNIISTKINYGSKIIFLKQSRLHDLLCKSVKIDNQERNYINVPLALKRLVDIFMASSCILILSPLLVVIAVAIKLESNGSVFYTSLRAGKGFKVFKFYKFRSMIAEADKEVANLSAFNQYDSQEKGPKFFKVSNDPRITRFGKFLRNTSADELPQLLNVLKGDMSLVGNRPLPLYEAVTLTTDEFVERFSAPAGITGLWQVNKRGKAEMSAAERVNLDITYSKNFSFYYDLKIMAKTPLAIFQKSDV